jgi:putative aldouronate transport system substrate-binding protein
MRKTLARGYLSAILGIAVCAAAVYAGGGRQNVSSGQDGGTGPLEIHAMLVQYQQPPNPNGAFWKDMEARYNIKYTADWVQDTAYSEKLALVLSTNSIPDIVQVTSTTEASVVRAIEAGMFKDLTPYLDWNKYPNLGKISSSAWINSKYKGRNYVFPRSRGQYNDSVMIRGDILNKYNLPKPTTLDQFTAYLEAVVKEGGIGIPFWVQKSIDNYFQPCFGPGSQVPLYTQDRTGIVPRYLCESYALAVDYIRGLYSRGLVAKEFAMIGDAQTENAMVSGKGGMYFKNVWHRFRLNQEIQKNLPSAEIIPLFWFEGPGGVSLRYDSGFYGGIMVNTKLAENKFLRLMDFFEQTSKPENYNYFTYGLEGQYWTLVDGFPQLTEEGKKDVNNSFYCPYVLATDIYNKVDSPLAPPAYNRETREMVKELDLVAARLGHQPFGIFGIISSQTWANFWAMNESEFLSRVVDTITGKMSMNDFRAYQQQLLGNSDVQKAMKEFKQSWDEFGLANWKAPAL